MLELIDKMYKGARKPTGFMKHYYTLFSIVEGLEAKNTFEFGTGLSTHIIIDALKITGGKHTSNDVRDLVNTGIDMSLYVENTDIWTFVQGPSSKISKEDFERMGPFDFVLHDGSHIAGEVMNDLRKIVTSMKKNSILLVHDTENELFSTSLKHATKRALEGIEYESITLPYSYGLTIIRILENFGVGEVNPLWKK